MRLAIALAAASIACDDPAAVTIPAARHGEDLFSDPAFSPSQFNVFACATCHGDDGARRAVAVSLARTVDREAWWGGKLTSVLEAADFCWVYFMRGFPSLDPADEDARALFEYLDSLGEGEPLPALPLTVVETIVDPGPGNAAKGVVVFDRSCRVCHGDPHTGDGRIGDDVLTIPEASQAVALELGVDARLVVVEKVRHGQFFGVGGNMPFYPLEVLSDEELSDVMEYLNP